MMCGPKYTLPLVAKDIAVGPHSIYLGHGDSTTCPRCGQRGRKLHRDRRDCIDALRRYAAALEIALCDEIVLLDAWGRHQQLGAPLHQRADELRDVLLGKE